MATGSSSSKDDGPRFPALVPRPPAEDAADELRLLWRALLVVSGDAVMSEAALLATVDACRPWSDNPDRLTIWLAGFQALEAEQERTDVHLLGKPDSGPRASDIQAITDYLNTTTPARRRMLVGHHVGGLSTEDLQRFVADGDRGEDLAADQLTEWLEHDSGAAAQVLLIKPPHWIDVLSLLQPPVRPERLLRADSRPWRSWVTIGGLAIVALLFLALFSLNRGTPPVIGGGDSSGDETSEGDAGADGGSTGDEDAVAIIGSACPAAPLVSRVLTSPVYQAGLEPRSFSEVLDRTDLVVRGAVASIELAGGGIRFELDDPQVLFGQEPAPSSFLLNARFDATGDPVPNGVLFPDSVVFLNSVAVPDDGPGNGERWEVAEAGGFWVSCGESEVVAVGADWPTGADWPDLPTPAELARTINGTLQSNAEFITTEDGQRTVGGFQMFDGRTVVLQLPSGMQPAGEMSASIRPLPDVLALVGGPDLRLVLREQACDPVAQDRAPLAVCNSTGEVMIEIASPIELSDAWLERIDVFTVDNDKPRRSNLVIEQTRSGEIVAIDPVIPDIVWRAALRPGEFLAGVGESEVAVRVDGNLRVFDGASGAELWGKKINPWVGAIPVTDGWLVAPPELDPAPLELVDGVSGDVLWEAEGSIGLPALAFANEELILVARWDRFERSLQGYRPQDGTLLWDTDPELIGDPTATTLLVDQEGQIMVTVGDEGTVRLIELADGRTRWTTSVPSATSIDGIWLSTMTVNSNSGQLITINLADGFILPP